MDFGKAIELLKQGKLVQREGWNGKGLFVFRQVPAVVPSAVVSVMQSLPIEVKVVFENRFKDPTNTVDHISYKDQLALVNESNSISGWSPSTNDALATDWIEYKG